LSSSSEAQFVVTDNGAGFDPSVVVAGAGLVNISDRLAALGGAVVIDSGPGPGCRVEGRAPLAGP